MTSPDPSAIVVWQGDSWQLVTEPVRLPDGTVGEKAYIDHPGAVVLVPLRESDAGPQILVLEQYRQALHQTILELPAGTRRREEPWLACAQRELREETGHRADDFKLLAHCWPAPGVSNERMVIYLARGLQPDPLPKDWDEQIQVRPILLQDLVAMALDGRLQDAKSIVGVWHAAALLGSFPGR